MKENNNDYENMNLETDNVILNINQINPTTLKKKEKKKKSPIKKGKKRSTIESDFKYDQTPSTNENIEVKKFSGIEKDNFIENDFDIRNIINSALFSQLSEIKVFLLDFQKEVTKKLYKTDKKKLPKIHYVELNLLNQGVNISEFKKYGFGIYIFFLYLISILVTFFVLLIFVFYYIYCIFFHYYQDLDVECSAYFECNILSLASGVQIIKFRKYYIEKYGKKAFLKKYENFDVFYKEYIFSGVIVFIVAFLIDFGYILYSRKVYKEYKKENPDINNYTLILSGKDLPHINNKEIDKNKKYEIKNKKEEIKKELKELLNIKDVDISFTLELSDLYEKLEDYTEKIEERIKVQNTIAKGKCLFLWRSIERLKNKEKELDDDIGKLKEEMDKLSKEENYCPLYLLTFQNKKDYEHIYSKYPHSYFIDSIKNLCKKEKGKNIYINKAPNPEDVAWENLQFDNEYKYYKNKFIFFGKSCGFIALTFVLQLVCDLISNKIPFIVFQVAFDIIIFFIQEKTDHLYSEFTETHLKENLNNWSLSDIKFYCLIYNSIFNLINQGFAPLLTYLITDKIYNDGDDYSNLVTKMFVTIEMNGFGYPMFDLLYNVIWKKGREMYKAQKNMMTSENIDKEIKTKIDNEKGMTRFKLENKFKKKEMDLDGNFSEILSTFWITMFYLPIYPIGIIQSFLNLLFKFIIEKNFLINIYKRPEYTKPDFGFLCFNFFNFGFFLFLCGNIIFFKNEDNKNSFGAVYIIIMVLFLILPFFLLAKLIIYCCYKKEKAENLEDVKGKLISDYRIFNPCYQKEEIKRLFSEFKNNKTLELSQYEEIEKKINLLNDLDLYKLQQNMRIPKTFYFFEKEINSFSSILEESYKNVSDEEKIRLYNLLMKLDFFSYLEEQNFIKPKKKKFELIENLLDDRSISLKNLSIQENLSFSDSTYFTTFYEKKDILEMAYVNNERSVKLFNVFDRKVLNEIKTNTSTKICCIDAFQVEIGEEKNKEIINYLVMISLDNKMIIYNLSIKNNEENKNKKSITIDTIGEEYKKNEDKKNAKNIFSLSTVKRGNKIWIITSYYYDKYYKIYDLDDILNNIDAINININYFIKSEILDEYIISLKASFLTENNSYIITRSETDNGNQIINLFINEFFIKKLYDTNDSYINFIIIKDKYYLLVSNIKKDLSKYEIKAIYFYQILPLYITVIKGIRKVFSNEKIMNILNKMYLQPGEWKNNNAFIPINQEIKDKIKDNPHQEKLIISSEFSASNNQKEFIKKLYQSNNEDKFNLGNLLSWENDFILFATPFGYIDIIDTKKSIKINDNNNINNNSQKNDNIIIYNFSEMIKDPEYGLTFILRDNKGKIQYMRPVILKDRLNYSVKKTDGYFNDHDINEKLEHIYFSYNFYFYYTLISLLFPLIAAFVGRNKNADEVDHELIKSSIILLAIYAGICFWFKGFVYDLNDISHTQRICTKRTIIACLVLKVLAVGALAYSLCQAYKTGIYFVIMYIIIYCVQIVFNFVIYIFKIEFILRTHWLGFAFYQISRLCILVFFVISVFAKVDNIQIYIYAAVLCVVSAYMYLANYFNTLFEEIAYNNYLQAIFNYPMEWMNLICCWFVNPRDLIMGLDYAFCCCDSCFIIIGECILILIMFFFYFIFSIFSCFC